MYSSNSAMNTALAGAYLAEEDKRRREAEGQPRQDNLLDTIGKIALAAGATTGAVVAGRRLAGGQNTSATFDLSKVAGEGAQNIRRAAAAKIAPKDVVPPSRPVPTTGVERQRQVVEDTIRARSERPQGIVTVDLPQPKTAFDPWTGRETITDPFGVATVPPGPNIREMSFVLGDLPEPTEAELARVLSKAEERSYPSAPLTRQQVFSTTAAKPESALPRVYRPKGGVEVELITDPNTGEIFRRGQSPESFKETYISLRPALTGQRTDLPQGRTPGTFAEFSQDVSGASAAGRLLEDPELLQLVRQQRRQEGAELGRESQRQSRIAAAIEQEADQALSSIRGQANTVQAAGQENFASQYLRNEGYTQADTLVDQQVSSNLNQVDQFVNAVNSAEDQQTGRVKLAFQRNEDENLAAIELAEDRADARLATLAQASPESAGAIEVDAAINTVASQRPDGMPLDQAEGTTSAQRFLQRERSEIASQLGEQGLPLSPSRIEAELANRVAGSEAWKYGPKYTQRKQALQLGATYDPQFFDNLKAEAVTIAGETVPVSSLKEPVAMKDTALRLQERAEQKRDWLGSVRLEEQKNKVRLDNVNKQMSELESYRNEVANFLRSGRASSEQRQLGQQRLADISLDLDRLDTQRSELANRVFIGEKRIAGARRAVEEGIASLELPQKLKSGIEEGQRIFFEVDPKTGQPIPGTQELRSEKYAIDLEPKAAGGRQVAEFDLEGQSGQVKDIYGIRLASALPDDPETRPSKPGPSRTPLTQEITPERLESFDVSRQLRQLQTSGRPGEAQAFLDKIMKQRGISGATGSFSLL
jgi:hypothetical protein